MTNAVHTASPREIAPTLTIWVNRGLELLWLMIVVLVPLAFVSREYMVSEAAIAHLEIPKIAVLRTLAGLIAVLWLIEWGMTDRTSGDTLLWRRWSGFNPAALFLKSHDWLRGRPTRWLVLAVLFYLATTLLSTVLSASFSVSIWGEVPGQDGYATYTIVSYVLLFGVIATHLKTAAQLWRLMGALVLVGVAVGGYGVLQHYGFDLWRLMEPPGATSRVSSTVGNPILAGAVLLMTIVVTTVVATISLRDRLATAVFWGKAGMWALVLAVQMLGMVFTVSRGPWIGTMSSLLMLIGLSVVFLDRRTLIRAILVLGLAGALVWVIIVSPIFEVRGEGIAKPSFSSEVVQRFASTRVSLSQPSGVGGGGLSGRAEFWKGSWNLMLRHPWFEFDDLSLSSLRPVIGYGPDLFRYVYLLESPAIGLGLLPKGPRHAHNYFIHQGVEQGFLGMASSLALFAALFLVGSYQLLKVRTVYSVAHRLIIIGLMATMVGRFVEQMVGVARVSDLTVFWAMLAVFVALERVAPGQGSSARSSSQPRGRQRSVDPLQHSRLSLAKYQTQTVMRLALVTFLIAGIATVTWVKTLNYPRAAVAFAELSDASRPMELQARLDMLDRAIGLAPDVQVYYEQREALYGVFRNQEGQELERKCSFRSDGLSYRDCLAQHIYINSLQEIEQRPFDYRSRLALARAKLALASDKGDSYLVSEAIELFREAAEMVPNSWPAWNLLASAYFQVGRPEEALATLNRSLSITSGNETPTAILLQQAVVYRHMGRNNRALEALREAGRVESPVARVYYDRGALYHELGLYQEALEAFNQALKINRNYAKAYYGRGLVYSLLGQPHNAYKDFDAVIRLEPQNVLAYNQRGNAYFSVEKIQLAIASFDEAIRLDPGLAHAYMNRGVAYQSLGQPQRSIDDLDQAIRLNPRFSKAYQNRALAYASVGRDSEARQDVQRAIELGLDPASLEQQLEEIRKRR